MHSNHGLRKFINQKIKKNTIFVSDPYPKTTKLGYWLIVLNMHKCGKLEVYTETLWFPRRQIL